jgi:hypothetical protein
MDQVGRRLREAGDRPVGVLASLLGEFLELRDVGDISCRGHVVEVFLFQFLAVRIQFGKPHAMSRRRWRIVCQHDRLRLDLQVMMLGQDVELMDPVAEGIAICRAPGCGIRDEAERQAALRLVVHRTQADFVIALRNRSVIPKFRCVQQMISVHATTA